MNKLIEIAKANGADLVEPYTSVMSKREMLTMNPDQLRATVEQVCAPLVAALNNYRESEMNGLGAVFNTPAKESLEYYRTLIGDKE